MPAAQIATPRTQKNPSDTDRNTPNTGTTAPDTKGRTPQHTHPKSSDYKQINSQRQTVVTPLPRLTCTIRNRLSPDGFEPNPCGGTERDRREKGGGSRKTQRVSACRLKRSRCGLYVRLGCTLGGDKLEKHVSPSRRSMYNTHPNSEASFWE
mgnify:CR=1 FL=1